ncbi:hypothetical protein ACFVU2_01875 [Leifsonia sp. NPDC058194]|uniref:hypothetical protein n=1 Tax=Leifsonia sp. NPDC058194 TaxID=3346374 RepID=UPI0036DDA38C
MNALQPPRAMGQLVHKVVGDVLSRGPLAHQAEDMPNALDPQYSGSALNHQLLVDDIVGTASSRPIALGTSPEAWPAESEFVCCIPEPPARLALHFQPNLPTPEEMRVHYRDWFAGKRVLIVGGQIEESVIGTLGEVLGIEGSSVTWVASERHKKAGNLKATIYGMSDADIIICIVGKVGHDVSGQMDTHCSKKGYVLHSVRFASHVKDYLEGMAT